MSTAPVAPPRIGPQQRLNATVVLSLLVHGILVLGLGFAFGDEAPMVPTLDVIFSQTSTPLTPEQADFLAQANNRGGGEHDQARRPREMQAGSVPLAEPGQAPEPARATALSPLLTPSYLCRVRALSPRSDSPQPPPGTRPATPPEGDSSSPLASCACRSLYNSRSVTTTWWATRGTKVSHDRVHVA